MNGIYKISAIVLLTALLQTASFAAESDALVQFKKVSVEMNKLFRELYALEKKALKNDSLYAMKKNLSKSKSRYKTSMTKLAAKEDPAASKKFNRYNELKNRQKDLLKDLVLSWSGQSEVDEISRKLVAAKSELSKFKKDLVNLRKMPSADPKVNSLKKELAALQNKLNNNSKLAKLKENIAKAKSSYQKKLNSPEIIKLKEKVAAAKSSYKDELANGSSAGISKNVAETEKELDKAIINMLKKAAEQHNEKFSTPEDLKVQVAKLTEDLTKAKMINDKSRKIRDITGEMKDIIKKK